MKKIIIGIAIVIGLLFSTAFVSGVFSGMASGAKRDKSIMVGIREKIKETQALKQAIEVYYRANSSFPQNDIYTSLNLTPDQYIQPDNVKSFAITSSGEIQVELSESLLNARFVMTPKVENGNITWICKGSNLRRNKFWPEECR